MLEAQPAGGYVFLPNAQPIAVPFSAVVVAAPGHEIVHAVLDQPIPYRAGFQLAEQYLSTLRQPRTALCGVELRCTEPYTVEGFQEFNRGYAELLQEWGLFADGLGAATRTNVAPHLDPPTEQIMVGFFYAIPSETSATTFVMSGAFENPDVLPGETSSDAIKAKAADVMTTLSARLASAGLSWDQVTAIRAYTPHDLWPALRHEVLPRAGAAARGGVHWIPSRVPVGGFEIEIDAYAVREELRMAAPSRS
jgi:hypothetical protein